MDAPVSAAVGDVRTWLSSESVSQSKDPRFTYYVGAVTPYLDEWAKSQPKKGGLHDNLQRNRRAQYKACRAYIKSKYKPAPISVTAEGQVIEAKGGLILTLILFTIFEAALSWAVQKYLDWLWNNRHACMALTDSE